MIKGLPEDGDVRNTVLFRNIAPFIHSISTNQLIFELLRVVEGWDEVSQKNLRGFESHTLLTAFAWRYTPNAELWNDLDIEHTRNLRANR